MASRSLVGPHGSRGVGRVTGDTDGAVLGTFGAVLGVPPSGVCHRLTPPRAGEVAALACWAGDSASAPAAIGPFAISRADVIGLGGSRKHPSSGVL